MPYPVAPTDDSGNPVAGPTGNFSYSPGGTDTVSQIRLLIGDTDITDAELADEEILAFSVLFPDSIFMLASNLCTTLAAKYARQVQTSGGGVSAAMQQRHAQYLTMAERFRLLAKAGGKAVITPTPFVGGTQSQTCRPPIFQIGMNDYPGSSIPPELINAPFDQGDG